MNYLVFSGQAEAEQELCRINSWFKQTTGGHWGDLKEHPVKFLFAVPFDERVRGAFGAQPLPGTFMDEAEASKAGFYFRQLNGRFYQPLHKCQEAELLFQSLESFYPKVPFPVARSLFMSILGALYAAQQQLGKILKGPVAVSLLGHAEIQVWWKERTDEMHLHGELLHYLHGLNNSEKHGEPSVIVGLRPRARYYQHGGIIHAEGGEYMGDSIGTRMSAEGVFVARAFANGYELWKPQLTPEWAAGFGIHGVEFTFDLLGLPSKHLGQDHGAVTPVEVAKVAIDYHYELIREAIEQWKQAGG